MPSHSSYSLSMPATFTCDVLIIGSGVGGATLAHELVSSEIDTLMIEEGPFIENISERTQHENFSEVWRNGGLTIATGKPVISYAEGSCIGGGSEINSGIFQYAPGDLLNKWSEKYSINEFSAEKLKSFYETAETMVKADYQKLELDSLLLEQAANNLGWKSATLKVARKNNVKQSMSATLLPSALEKGLRLIARCKAIKLIFKNNLVVGVKAIATDYEGKRHKVIIKPDHVFLCSGAVYTPHLLLKSGVKKNIGQTLRLHPTIKALCEFNQPVSRNPSFVPSCAITEFMPDVRIGGSVMQQNFIAMSIAEDLKNRGSLLKNMDYCGVYYAMIRPEGVGKIRTVPGCSDPVVSFHLTKNDWKKIFMGLDYLQQAMFSAGAISVFPSVERHSGWKEKVSLEEIHTILQNRINLMTIHLFSSCPMGENKSFCAVDSFGKVHDYQNLYICDASIIPEALGTNPQGTIMALALRNAKNFINHTYGMVS